MNVFLIGFMGCGKSTLGKTLAENLNFSFIDSDSWIENLEGRSIPEIFKQNGEPYFRKKEREFIEFAHSLKNTVVATGAGLPCMHDNMEQMNQIGITIWLEVDEKILVERLKNENDLRPKLREFSSIEEAVHALLEDRKQFYKQAVLHVKNPTAENLVDAVRQKI